MGVMIEGKWTTDEDASALSFADGRFQRAPSIIRNWVTPDGTPGPTGEGGFKAEPNRYHLFVSLNCPWAHRTLIFRVLKGLTDMIPVSVTLPRRTDQGWVFDDGSEQFRDECLGKAALWEVYAAGYPGYTGRVTVPVLFDTRSRRIVSNESADIIRMLDSAFDQVAASGANYYPRALRPEIDALNDRIYRTVNNGVYRAGFARTQEAYEEAFDQLFETLDTLDLRLYITHFKCNLRRLIDYENLWNYTRDLYQVPGVAETVNLDHIKRHYFMSHTSINPTRIVPKGPAIDFSTPHDRGRFLKGRGVPSPAE